MVCIRSLYPPYMLPIALRVLLQKADLDVPPTSAGMVFNLPNT